jgi:DNA-binding LytR/AlgR family response regulator
LTEQIENLVCNYTGTDCILGYRDDELRKLTFREIECITIIDRKVIAIDTLGNHYRIQDRLRDLEELLPSYFIRINKSTLANEHRILRFDAVFSGGVDAVFQCGYREYVSRRCFADIRRRYERS